MKTYFLIFPFLFMVFVGCENETQTNAKKNSVNTLNVPEPAICEGIDLENDCRSAGCSWTISKLGTITDGACSMEEAWTHRCLSIIPGIEINVPVGYYRETENGYQIIAIDDKGENLLGWSRCDSHDGWSQDCSGCDFF